eukprot:1257588-Amphidinium_carterae.1
MMTLPNVFDNARAGTTKQNAWVQMPFPRAATVSAVGNVPEIDLGNVGFSSHMIQIRVYSLGNLDRKAMKWSDESVKIFAFSKYWAIS